MKFKTITDLVEAITSGSYQAEEPDLPFENIIYEPFEDFETAFVMRAGQNSLSFYKEKQKQSFDLWLFENENHTKVLSITEKKIEPERTDNIETSAESIYYVDLNSTLEIPEYLELIKDGSAELNQAYRFEKISLADLFDVFFLIPVGTKNLLEDSFLLPVKSFQQNIGHPIIEKIKAGFLVLDKENTAYMPEMMRLEVIAILNYVKWQTFYHDNSELLVKWGIGKIKQPFDIVWYFDNQLGSIRNSRLDTTQTEIPIFTHKPIMVTRAKPEYSVNFINDEIEISRSIKSYFESLDNDGIREEEVFGKLTDFSILVPGGRLQQIKHSFERRFLKYKLRDRFDDLMFHADKIPADKIIGYYQSRISGLDEFMG